MGKTASVIDINGVRYDAVTGNALSKVKKFAKLKAVNGSQVIDGFVRARKKEPTAPVTKPAAAVATKKNRPAHTIKTNAKNIHQRTERSKTLVRSVVVKPTLRIKEASKTFSRSNPSNTASSADKNKLDRARKIAKHSKVERFGTPKVTSDITAGAEVGEVITRPHKVHSSPSAKATNDTALPSMVASASHQQLERLLDVALHTASSHKKTYQMSRTGLHGKIIKMPKWMKIVIVSLVVLATLGFFVWRNMPTVAVKIAGLEAGVHTSTPAYIPVGYTYRGTTTGSSEVNISYRGKLDSSKNYVVVEKKSNLDSTTLSASPSIANNQVQTSNINGNSVYIYGARNDVTWVNEGVQYTIENRAGLTSDQLVSIVQSMQ